MSIQPSLVSLPPSLDRVPERFLADLQALNSLSDEMLQQIACSDINNDQADQYQSLLEQNQRGALDAAGQARLSALREEADRLMFRRSFAYALLQRREH